MNPDSPKTPREEMELRITALLLGELSAQEAAAVRELISHDRELTLLHDRLKQAITLVREAAISVDQPASAPTAPLKMSEERREKLLAHFKTVTPKEFVPEKKRAKFTLVELAAVIAILGVLAAISIPNFVHSRTTSQSNAIMNNLRQIDAAKQQWALEKNKSATDVPTLGELKPYLGRGGGELPPSVSGETYVVGKVADPVTAEMNAAPARNWFSWLSGPQTLSKASDQRVFLSSDGERTFEEGKHRPVAVTAIPVAPAQAAANESLPRVLAPPTEQSLPPTPAVAGEFAQRLSRTVRHAAASGESDKVTETSRPVTQPPAQIVLPSTTLADADAESSGAKVLADNSSLGIAGRPIANVNSSAFSSGAVPSKDGDHLYFGTQHSEPSLNTDPTTGLPTGTVVADGFTPLTTAPATEPPAPRFGGFGGFGGGGAGGGGSGGSGGGNSGGGNSGGGGSGIGGRGEVAGVHYNFVTNSVALANNSFQNSGGLSDYQVHAGFDTASLGVSSGRLSITENAGPPPDANGNKVPVLGNLPVEGRLFRSAHASSASSTTTSPGFSLLGPAELPKLNSDTLTTSSANTFVGGAVVNNGTLALSENRSKADGFNLNVAGIAEDQAVKVRDLAEQHSNHGNPQNALAALQKTFDIKPDSKKVAMDVGGESSRRLRSPIVLPSSQSTWQIGKSAITVDTDTRNPIVASSGERLAVEPEVQSFNAPGLVGAPARGVKPADVVALTGIDPAGNRVHTDDETDAAHVRKPSTNAPIPQPEIQTSENNFSTFSLNVSDVSFKLAAASLEKGQMPDPASIRSEEFINAFDYRDPEATAGSPIAFAYERARYPFAHNRDLLRFSLKTAAAGRQAGRPLNIVLLLDNSGSMERADRVQIIREALRVLASQLQPQDKFSVITFARTARLFADGASGDKAGEIAEQVSGLTPEGGTNLEDAMNLAYQTAAKHYLANGINRVVLLTDGAANLGDVEPDSLKQKVEAQRKQGIALDCFGIGWEGFNDDLLEVLSRNGDGRYGFINSPEEAATDFVGQLAGALKVAASDVKVQVEFNPKRVTSYRQIGYAKHQLTKEQFRDNTVDAAEIAAQEAGNALYTVEVNPAGDGPLCTVRARYKIPGTTDYREQAWDVPYTGNALSLEQASPAMRLAASATAFAEWLVASPFAGEVTSDRVLGVLSGVPEVYGADSRPKKLEWMIREAKSLEGK